MKISKSKTALFICSFTLLIVSFFYYPKWKQHKTEATISWDVSGYYMYLPAIFIYKDLKQVKFLPNIINKYGPTPNMQQVIKHESGNYVMKYSIGQAVIYLPFFGLAHFWASLSSNYEADGFSYPYQFMISFGSLLIALLGLFLLRKILLHYFEEDVTAVTLVCLVLGTNYLDYSSINGAMTHNSLFTIYALLIYAVMHYYSRPTIRKSILIGGLIGLAALTRPTEIIACLIPILWGVNPTLKTSVIDRLNLFKKNYGLLLIAVFTCILVGSIQLFYWKFATGNWIVYSYGEDGFSWLKPHFHNGFLSYRSGWLVYSPMMIFALLGFYSLIKGENKFYALKHKEDLYSPAAQKSKLKNTLQKANANIWLACLVFSLLFIYLAFAWDIWWYGNSLGQRSMVQAYPILALPMAAFFSWMIKSNKFIRIIFGGLLGIFICYNFWLTHQAHRGGLLRAGEMTKAYFWKTLGTFEHDINNEKLLDNKESFSNNPSQSKQLFFTDFESDMLTHNCNFPPIKGNHSFCLNINNESTPLFEVPVVNGQYDWIRATADFRIEKKDWNYWTMTQFIIRYSYKERKVKENMIRVQRLLHANQTSKIFVDASCPKKPFDKVTVLLWNANGTREKLLIDNLLIEGCRN